jgi:DivIVA domain-containing protein
MSDLDLPLLPSAEQIRRRQFATVRRGYDPDQVHDYLNQVAMQVEALEGELREERLTRPETEMAAAAPAAPPAAIAAPAPFAPAADVEAAYERISARLTSVLRAADDEAQKLIEQARAEAQRMLDEARGEAERIQADARVTAEEARSRSADELQRAQAEADRVLGGLEQRRESLLGQMHEMQSRLLAVAQNLEIPDEDVDAGTGAHIAAPAGSPEREAGANGGESADRPAPVPVGKAAAADDAVDPRYEDMWATPQPPSVDIPDLSSLDVDFDDEHE